MSSAETSILRAIDQAHLHTQRALKEKNIDLYLNGLSDSIQYTQLNGVTIGKAQLRKDTEAYFNRIHSIDHAISRDSHAIENNVFTETISQDTSMYVRVFILFLVKWQLRRKGIYSWRIEAGDWKMVSAKITEEKIERVKGIWFFTRK